MKKNILIACALAVALFAMPLNSVAWGFLEWTEVVDGYMGFGPLGFGLSDAGIGLVYSDWIDIIYSGREIEIEVCGEYFYLAELDTAQMEGLDIYDENWNPTGDHIIAHLESGTIYEHFRLDDPESVDLLFTVETAVLDLYHEGEAEPYDSVTLRDFMLLIRDGELRFVWYRL